MLLTKTIATISAQLTVQQAILLLSILKHAFTNVPFNDSNLLYNNIMLSDIIMAKR